MKDFLKIFGVLCLIVAAFAMGRNYGEKSLQDSTQYQAFLKDQVACQFDKNQYENLKAKFQNVVDGASTKKTEELLGQILQIFLADLGLRIQNQQAFLKIQSCTPPEPATVPPVIPALAPQPAPLAEKKSPRERAAVADIKKFHSYEWMLTNSGSASEVQSNLKNVEIKNIDPFLKSTTPATPQQMESIYGSYRGRVFDQSKNEFATLAIEINLRQESEKTLLTGSIKMFKNGKETVGHRFTTSQLGYAINGSSGFIIDSGNHYYQVYKITGTQQIAGYFYERLPNGTTNTIGAFTLNRVDQF